MVLKTAFMIVHVVDCVHECRRASFLLRRDVIMDRFQFFLDVLDENYAFHVAEIWGFVANKPEGGGAISSLREISPRSRIRTTSLVLIKMSSKTISDNCFLGDDREAQQGREVFEVLSLGH